MPARALLLAVMFGLFAWTIIAAAQEPGRIYRIGTLEAAAVSRPEFWEGLRDLGWVEGKNLVVERRFADGKPERYADMAAELVRLKVDLLVPITTPATIAAKNATSTIPIVFLEVGDPVLSGVVASLARPAGNVTGLSSFNTDLSAKRLDLLKTMVPRASRVAVLGCCLGSSADPLVHKFMDETAAAGKAMKVTVQPIAPNNLDDAASLFTAMAKGRPDALLVLPSPRGVDYLIRNHVVDLAIKHRLPTIFDDRRYAEAGGLMAYGVHRPELYQRAAALVDRVLKGAHPADLPVQQPTKFELVVNLKTAKILGITMPQSLLLRANHIID
jgi:putative ABC transport system substrate-binding protein